MKIAFKTFGCKANSLDSDALYHEALRQGFQVVPEDDFADAYVINSCTVTRDADHSARVQANKYKRQNPLALVGVIGCYAQVAKDELLAMQEVDFVVGTANKHKILDHFLARSAERDQVELPKGFLPEHFPGSRQARASVKIQDGCNFSCSFCIIPQARGRSRSLPVPAILKQIDAAYAEGFQEVVLTGIHLAHYGWDLGTDLGTLLRAILAPSDGPRIRVSSLDPFEIPDQMVAWLGQHPRFCPHFHIALQSGSDKVLRGMRRIYQAKEFLDVAAKIEAQCSDTFIGLDVIVGFPGEGEKEFQETLHSLENSFWTKLHVFPFSARKGTRAETLPEAVSAAEKAARSLRLRTLSETRYQSFLRSQVGKQRNVLLERPSLEHPGLWKGHTENYLPTYSVVVDPQRKSLVASLVTGVDGDRALTRPLS